MSIEDGPLVSIAIVTHNNWPDLELALAAALNQSYTNTEVVLVDNDSSDETEQRITSSYMDKLRYVRQPNTRDSGGYNRGIAEARGEFIQLLDADDFIAPNKIEKQLDIYATRPDADIVYGDTRQFQGAAGRPEWSDWNTVPQDDMLLAMLDPGYEGAGMVTHAPLFRKAALNKVGKWDEAILSADQDFWIRCAWAGCVFVHSPGAWCFHRRRSGQMSSDSRAMIQRMDQTLTKALTYIDREPYRSLIKRRVARLRYGVAVTDLSLTRSEALSALDSAREMDSSTVSALAYTAAYAAIATPGARGIVKSRALRSARQRIGRLLEVME